MSSRDAKEDHHPTETTPRDGCAVITGGSRGIGLATAFALGARGLSVAVLAPASVHLDDAHRDLSARGITTLALACDVSDEHQVDRAAHEVLERFGAPRVVVANAGIVKRAGVHEMPVGDFDRVVGVNLRGTFLTARAFIGAMRSARRGRFIAVASISATLGTANASAYNASKWGVVGFVKSLAEELRDTGVQALAINPGAVDTDMLKGSPYSAQMSAEDCARLISFLALDAPDAMNGADVDMFGP